jgi:hypothetical protein
VLYFVIPFSIAIAIMGTGATRDISSAAALASPNLFPEELAAPTDLPCHAARSRRAALHHQPSGR